MFFRRKDRTGTGPTAVAEPPAPKLSPEAVWAEIETLTATNRATPRVETATRLLMLRNLAGIQAIAAADGSAQFPSAEGVALPDASAGLPEFRPEQLTPELVRAAILRDGCILVRGLISRDIAVDFAGQIDRAFAERDRHDNGEDWDRAYYSELVPDPRYGPEMAREWLKQGGGLLATDAPGPAFNMLEMLARAGMPSLVGGYLGEAPLIACQKTTLRKAEPSVPGAWHQDGKFMGPVRALNMWLSLSRCGDDAPGLDIVPTRLDYLVTANTEEAMLDYMVSQKRAEEAAGETPIIRPIFEPGDALFFDELFLHKTGSDPAMPNPRFAIESWFFGASAFAGDYAPVAVS